MMVMGFQNHIRLPPKSYTTFAPLGLTHSKANANDGASPASKTGFLLLNHRSEPIVLMAPGKLAKGSVTLLSPESPLS